ncbi:MAG: GGDEF domain-containing protein [Campylobacterota bacterium]|nr:GGDEF domain-containing protein [Campylobacterota bacterium]
MQSKSKLLISVTLMLLALTIATLINISLNFKDYSLDAAIKKSKLTASIVEGGLTAHMINGNMPQRQYFLNEISNNSEIESLWVVRSDNVTQQYGKGFKNEIARDAIDKNVIKNGLAQQSLSDKNILRITIPYKATSGSGVNSCISCHDVNIGDTLGAISMEFDLTHTRDTAIVVILKILGINLLFILVALILVNYITTPYITFFKNLEEGIQKAYRGDFTHKFNTGISGNTEIIVNQMNTLFSKMQTTFGDIKQNLATFTPQNSLSTTDPLYEAKIIIHELSDIYKFKKTIERDLSKGGVYSRIISVLKTKYNLQHFAFYEIDDTKSTRNLVYIVDSAQSICLEYVDKKAHECRAYRTQSDVISTDFTDLCQTCEANGKEYLCIFFNINTEVSIVLSITATTNQEIVRINSLIPSIKHYLEAAKPVIESKVLTEKLRDTSLRDAMTGLYNRRFLEEFIDQVMSQAQREGETYSVMMLDVDFFKMVNDTYGHDVGDKVIAEIGKVLQENIRDADLAIRYGGEEFIVMLHNATLDGTQKVAKQIHSAFANLIFDVGSGETMQKTMSIGIAMFPQDGDTIWKCIKFADTALYVAKTTGRNKIVNYKKEMSESEDVR